MKMYGAKDDSNCNGRIFELHQYAEQPAVPLLVRLDIDRPIGGAWARTWA